MKTPKLIPVLVSIVLALALAPACALAYGGDGGQGALAAAGMQAQDDSLPASGTCGTCTWEIDGSGALVVRPTSGSVGELDDWDYKAPWYEYRNRIVSARFSGTVKAKTCCKMFSGLAKMETLDLSGLDTSNVTNMEFMFDYCKALTSINLSPLNTSNVTSMEGMFASCSSLASLDLSPLKTPNVRVMNCMFQDCRSLVSLDLSPLDTSNVRSMSEMFEYCTSLTSVDLSKLKTPNVNNMDDMFSYCSSLVSVNLSSLDTSQVKYMGSMFSGCKSLTSIDLSGLNTSNVLRMGSMFSGCDSLTFVDLTGLDTSGVTSMYGMFANCKSLTSLDLTSFNTSNVKSMEIMFSECTSLKTVYVGSGWSTSSVENSLHVFTGSATLVGGNGTAYDEAHVDVEYARVDAAGQPGYLTLGPAPKISIAGASVSAPAQVYTGAELTPVPTVTLDGRRLVAGDDYDVAYSGNVNAGMATVTVTGKGAYGGTASGKFAISPAPIAKAGVKLSKATMTYTGKQLKPAVTVTLGGKKLVRNRDYTVTYASNAKPGTAKATVKGKGNYKGSKAVKFKVALGTTKVKKLTGAEQAFTATWARQKSGGVGYQVRYSLKKNMKWSKVKTVKRNATTKLAVKKLKANKTYYVQVRTYKEIGKKTYYSAWSAKKAVKTK